MWHEVINLILRKRNTSLANVKHPPEFPSMSLSLLLFCILRIDWKKEEISPFPSPLHLSQRDMRTTGNFI